MTPTATYRLQLRQEFGFHDAAEIVPYLAQLGISHLYLSPVLQAAPGSTHGYDVIDHSQLSADLGGDEAWATLVDACRREGLGIVIDLVPNHMAAPNPHYDDVVANGPASPYARWFDIDWPASEAAGQPVYRRFFDVSSLIGLRVEEPDVYAATHARVLDLMRRGDIDGLRVDHPDGLADPRGYLERLHDDADGMWTVVEKILEPGEHLPPDWRCSGTTGYDAITAITHVLLDANGCAPLSALYDEVLGEHTDYDEVVEASKRYVLEHVLSPEVDRLERELGNRTAIVEMLVAFDVYRAYAGEPGAAAVIERAAARARTTAPEHAAAIDRLATSLARDGNVRFEQTTGPVMAKGVEDTAFYRYFRLAALNEVGGDPGAFGISVDHWHSFCERLASDWPQTMTTLTTHDTKRTEDVRARLLVLAEIPDEWSAAVKRWTQTDAIDANTQYLFWQTLIGAWPLTIDRMQAYLDKATHEAKRQTSWITPDENYDDAVRRFVTDVMNNTALMADVEEWMRAHIDEPGRSNGLAQKLLQLTMPGVPDIYQGQELTAPALVDPDNRRPVDYQGRRQALSALDAGADDHNVEDKLRVTVAALRLRKERPASYDAGYAPLTATGDAADHVITYLRGDDVLAVVTRLPVGLADHGGWGDTLLTLPAGGWTDRVTGRGHTGTVPVREILATLPVALLARERG